MGTELLIATVCLLGLGQGASVPATCKSQGCPINRRKVTNDDCLFKLLAACDPSDNDDPDTMSNMDLAKNIWTKNSKNGPKVFPLEAQNASKAQACIDEFDEDKNHVWNQAEWKAFDEIMKDPFNWMLLVFAKEQTDSCIPTTVSFTAQDLQSMIPFLHLTDEMAKNCIDKYDGDRDGTWNMPEWKKFDKLVRKLAKKRQLQVLRSC